MQVPNYNIKQYKYFNAVTGVGRYIIVRISIQIGGLGVRYHFVVLFNLPDEQIDHMVYF